MSKIQNTRPANQADSSRSSLEDALREEAEESADSRVVRRAGQEERGDRGVAEDADRAQHSALMSDDDYERLVREEFEQTALPKPPALPGWHLCWLTTTSTYDNIAKRQRLGYRPVARAEMPGFDPSNGQDLERFAGYVTCNEMVLHKIPEPYFQRMMAYFHHRRPMEDEQGTLQKINQGLAEEAQQDSSGQDLAQTLGTGYLDMERTTKRAQTQQPRFHI